MEVGDEELMSTELLAKQMVSGFNANSASAEIPAHNDDDGKPCECSGETEWLFVLQLEVAGEPIQRLFFDEEALKGLVDTAMQHFWFVKEKQSRSQHPSHLSVVKEEDDDGAA